MTASGSTRLTPPQLLLARVDEVIDAPFSHNLVTGLRDLLIGQDPMDISPIWERMYQGTLYFGRDGAAVQARGHQREGAQAAGASTSGRCLS